MANLGLQALLREGSGCILRNGRKISGLEALLRGVPTKASASVIVLQLGCLLTHKRVIEGLDLLLRLLLRLLLLLKLIRILETSLDRGKSILRILYSLLHRERVRARELRSCSLLKAGLSGHGLLVLLDGVEEVDEVRIGTLRWLRRF